MQAEGMPNLLVAGAMRSGTTTIYRALSEHPEVFMSEWKEPHFLALAGERPTFSGPGDQLMNRNAVIDMSDYLELFRGAGGSPWRGEASATYLYLPGTVNGIRRYLTFPRVVVLLRDPVDRAYSAYQYLRGQGREPRSRFGDALREEDGRRAAGWSPMWHYLNASHYKPQLERLLAVVQPEHLHVVFFEDLTERPAEVLSALWTWLEVDATATVDLGTHNRGGEARSRMVRSVLRPGSAKHRLGSRLPVAVKGHMRRLREANMRPDGRALDSATRRDLIHNLQPDIDFVEALTGRRLDAWREM